jgi:hypothetical protein
LVQFGVQWPDYFVVVRRRARFLFLKKIIFRKEIEIIFTYAHEDEHQQRDLQPILVHLIVTLLVDLELRAWRLAPTARCCSDAK